MLLLSRASGARPVNELFDGPVHGTPMNIRDPYFDKTITLRDAYRAMQRFVEAHLSRGETSTVELLCYFGLGNTGESGDPAAFDDYKEALSEVESASGESEEVGYQLIIDDDIKDADQGAVEVRVVFADGGQRWCYFITPEALARVGDWIPGTQIPMHLGELHMFVVGECSEAIITQVLDRVATSGELRRRTLPC